MKRRVLPRRKSRKLFSKTAKKIDKRNLRGGIMRGGYRI